jgi:hypothetical protein
MRAPALHSAVKIGIEMTTENDIVLIYLEDQPLSFARVEEILADHKPDWYHVKLLLLQIPLQIVTWILRDVYIAGAEFTMNGKRMRLEKVVAPDEPQAREADAENEKKDAPKPKKDVGQGKVISLTDLKKK